MAKEIERLRVQTIWMPTSITSLSNTVKEAEKYYATSPEQHLNNKHGYFKECTSLQQLSILVSCGGFGPIFFFGIHSIIPLSWLVLQTGMWGLTIAQWQNRKKELRDYYGKEWQKQHELANNKLNIAAKNLTTVSDFFNKQADRFNKYQRYIESGVVSLDETQWAERKALCNRLAAIGNKITKRIHQLDYLLDLDAKPALEQEVMRMIDVLGQTEIANEIAKLLDPRFRTLTEAEMETKALAVLEELPQII